MFVQVYGPMHADIANCYRSGLLTCGSQCSDFTCMWFICLRHMARIEYMLGEPVNALSNQHKATLILERVMGVDHPDTIAAYINLALYCHASGQSAAALRLLYRWVWL